MTDFTFATEETLEAMAHAASVDLWAGQVTLYAVTCVGNGHAPHFSHGGQVCIDANEAMESAEYLNQLEHDCRYLPMALGCRPEVLLGIISMIGRGPEEDVHD